MTNFEKYKDTILNCANSGCDFGVDDRTNTLYPCSIYLCYHCKFSSDKTNVKYCPSEKIKWLYEEAK